MKNIYLMALAVFAFGSFARAEPFNSVQSAGNITSTNGNIVANGVNCSIYAANGSVQSKLFVSTAGHMLAGTYVQAGGAVIAGDYLQAVGAGAIGNYLRVGGNTNIPGSKSVQIGQFATNDSFNALVVGRYNLNKAKDGTTNPTPASWVDNDPLFVVGNGTGTAGADQYRNALTVYKDGTVTMSKAQGDILMGQFGN